MMDYLSPAQAYDSRTSLTNEYNVYYYGSVNIGTPAQEMKKMLFDNAYGYNLLEYDGCISGCSSPVF